MPKNTKTDFDFDEPSQEEMLETVFFETICGFNFLKLIFSKQIFPSS